MAVSSSSLTVVGGGLAGSSAAMEAAKRGVKVKLYEMRPNCMTPAHSTGSLAELVCSNSLGSTDPLRAQGLLKEEIRMLDCELLKIAEANAVPAGTALTVDREKFSKQVTNLLEKHLGVEIIREEVTKVPDGLSIMASGPLTSEKLSASISEFCGLQFLYFFDAIAPMVDKDSLNLEKLHKSSRYDAGDAGFLNAFLDKTQYLQLQSALASAEEHPRHDFEKLCFFEGCLPVEEVARRGQDSLAYGTLRPTGFRDCEGKRPYAVVQLRPENIQGTMYNLVGFQTNLRNSEQERVFRMIPGLENAEFIRYGRMHRNTYIEAPQLIKPTLQFRNRTDLLVCGQLSGAEGYLSAIATGLVAGINASHILKHREPLRIPRETMLGSLLSYISGDDQLESCDNRFTPTKPIFGILPTLSTEPKGKKSKREAYVQRSLTTLKDFLSSI